MGKQRSDAFAQGCSLDVAASPLRGTTGAPRHRTEPAGRKRGAESQLSEESGEITTSTLPYRFPYSSQNFTQETSRAPLQLLPTPTQGCVGLEMPCCGPHH